MINLILSGGVSLLEKKQISLGSIRQMLHALGIWMLTATVLLLIASMLLTKAETGSEILGYISSAISFLCALMAGTAMKRGGRGQRLLKGIVTALFLIILLLTVGFLIRGERMDSSGILSVVSFTLAGCVLGCVLPKRRNRKNRGTAQWRRRVTGNRFS